MTKLGVRWPGKVGKVLPESGQLSLGPISSWFTKCVPGQVSSPGAVPGMWDMRMGGWTRRLWPQAFPTAREGRLITEATVRCGEGHTSSHMRAGARMEGNGQVSFFSVKEGGSIR